MNLEKRYFISFILLFGAVFLYSCSAALNPRIGAATFSPDGQYLLFHADYKEGRVIYRIRKDGTELTQLTPAREDNFAPVYSPDGAKIVFARTSTAKKGAEADLYIMNSDGSNQSRLTSGPALDFAPIFSPDGQRIYFVRARWFGHHSPMVSSSWHDMDLYSIGIDGTDLKQVTDDWYYEMSKPSVSPDGKQILVRAIAPSPLTDEEALASIKKGVQDSLWLIPLDNPDAIHPIRPNLEKYAANRAEKPRVTQPLTYDDFYHPQFSPDGKSILFTWAASTSSRGYFEYEIYQMDLESKRVKKVTNLGLYTTSPSFSPDGKEIVFLFDPKWPKKNSPYELWLVNTAGTNPRRINIKL